MLLKQVCYKGNMEAEHSVCTLNFDESVGFNRKFRDLKQLFVRAYFEKFEKIAEFVNKVRNHQIILNFCVI